MHNLVFPGEDLQAKEVKDMDIHGLGSREADAQHEPSVVGIRVDRDVPPRGTGNDSLADSEGNIDVVGTLAAVRSSHQHRAVRSAVAGSG